MFASSAADYFKAVSESKFQPEPVERARTYLLGKGLGNFAGSGLGVWLAVLLNGGTGGVGLPLFAAMLYLTSCVYRAISMFNSFKGRDEYGHWEDAKDFAYAAYAAGEGGLTTYFKGVARGTAEALAGPLTWPVGALSGMTHDCGGFVRTLSNTLVAGLWRAGIKAPSEETMPWDERNARHGILRGESYIAAPARARLRFEASMQN